MTKTTVPFVKMNGTHNEFVVVDGRETPLDDPVAFGRTICDPERGLGADGLLLVLDSATADVRLRIINADGSEAEMCGNGIRVYARFLLATGLARLGGGEIMAIGTRAGVRDLQQNANGFQVDLGRWSLEAGEPLVRVKGLPVARPGLSLTVGNPHIVVALQSVEELRSADLTFIPQVEPEPAGGVNVEFVVPMDPLVKDGVGRIRMRVHERGSGETLSCGTGAVAAALATRHWAGPSAPSQWRVEVDGGALGVRMWPAEDGEHVSLSGPAELVYEGTISV